MKGKMLMTSGHNFENYSISEYLGVYSGECALGTGFLSSLSAGLSDLLGTNSKMYSNKLKEAKDYAIEQLQNQVIEAGGNAIIGVDIDYVSFSSDIMGVVASGTAVKLTGIPTGDENSTVQRYPVSITNSGLSFHPSSLYVEPLDQKQILFSLELFHSENCPLSAIMVDIEFIDAFQRSKVLENIVLSGFKEHHRKYLISDSTLLDFRADYLKLLIDTKVTVKKYIWNDERIDINTAEIEYIFLANSIQNNSNSVVSELLSTAEHLSNAREIYEYVVSYSEEHIGVIDHKLIGILESQKSMERFYGNHKDEALKEINSFFESK